MIKNKGFSRKSAVWNIGVILYRVLFQKDPYSEMDGIEKIVNSMEKETITFPDTAIEYEFIDSLKRMLICQEGFRTGVREELLSDIYK